MREGLVFIGVSTGGSSINAIFPHWAELLGLDAEIVGRDIAVRADAPAFRAAVREIADDERLRGALVTTHKVDVFAHARELFEVLDDDARLCGEISCISKRNGALVGQAKDPQTAGRSLDAMIEPSYWRRSGAHVLCLGAGGAGTAITVRLLRESEPPASIVVTDVDAERIATLRSIHEALEPGGRVDYHAVSSARDGDVLLSSLPPGSLVVNATGLGKDLPGSPLTEAARFPERAIVWDLNYRGELEFLRQAEAQAAELNLTVHDGWLYFLHGWTEVIAEVFSVRLDDGLFGRLEEAAAPFRP